MTGSRLQDLCGSVQEQRDQLQSLLQRLGARSDGLGGSTAVAVAAAAPVTYSRHRQLVVAHLAAGASSDRLPELLGCCLARRLQRFDDDSPVQLSVEV